MKIKFLLFVIIVFIQVVWNVQTPPVYGQTVTVGGSKPDLAAVHLEYNGLFNLSPNCTDEMTVAQEDLDNNGIIDLVAVCGNSIKRLEYLPTLGYPILKSEFTINTSGPLYHPLLVDLIIDDTPGIVTISSFNVIRKEIARMTLERLIADGRIHPAKIEEFHDKSRVELEARLRDLGEKAQMEIGVHGIHPEILKLVGALNYRTSYTQNQYQHALEASFLAGNMAAELGLNVKQARRAGLLHDIGKVLDASAEGSHAVIGADFAKKYGESPDIVHAIRSHHDDEKPESVLAHIVTAADALSGARPGARKAMMESYVSRLTDIEAIVNSFEGVSKSYAISAGREIRVIVENDKVSDDQTVMLSRDIARKIEDEMSYPGTIKVTVIRETRAVGVAK